MYRKTTRLTHFLPRKASYSTHPQRNGRVDVLPPSAVEPLYDCARQILDATEQLERLRIKRGDISDRTHETRRLQALRDKFSATDGPMLGVRQGLDTQLRQIDEEIAGLKRHIGSLKHLLAGGSAKTFEEAFTLVARAELGASVYESIAAKARLVLAAARAGSGTPK